MVTSVAPYPYDAPYVVEDDWYRRGEYASTISTELGTIEGSTDKNWRLLEPLLIGIDVLADREQAEHGYGTGRIVRVELIRRAKGRPYELVQQGAILIDQLGRKVCHVSNALIGYSGSGSMLTESILRQLGVSQEMFKEINRSVGVDYHVVVTRQQTGEVEGVVTALPYTASLDYWGWWVL